jgi:hypothetical protein
MSSEWVSTIIGAALGFGLASIAYMGVFVRMIRKLHDDNVDAAKQLIAFQEQGIQKVEEQNMHAVLKRLADVEKKVL